MAIDIEVYKKITAFLHEKNVTLVAVSKTKPIADILALYELGQRDFGENYVQELVDKQAALPKDIRWHFIGHLQSNKVKYIAPFVHLIHGIDSLKLLKEVNKQAAKNNRVIDCLLQVHIAMEESKFGMDEVELSEVSKQASDLQMAHSRIVGLMGMASLSEDTNKVRAEFRLLKGLFDRLLVIGHWPPGILSMGMSGDYRVAVEEGSSMVRIGSLLFGIR